MAFTVDTKEFERAMSALANTSAGTDTEILTLAGREMIFNVKNATPKSTGKGRAGWWPAWRGLGRSGNPGTRRQEGETKIKGRVYTSAGGFEDNRRNRGEPSISISNNSTVMVKGKKVNYLFISDARGKSAGWMKRGVDKTTEFFENMTEDKYARLLEKFGTR